MSDEIKEPIEEGTEEIVESTEATEPTQEATEEATEPTSEPTEPPIDTENLEDSLKEKGIDYDDLVKEYQANGDLTEETREKLGKLGLSKEFIDDFIAGKKAQQEKIIAEEKAELAKSLGGEETLNAVSKWASENLQKEEIEALNSITDMTTAKLVLKGLKAAMDEKEGVLPTLTTGQGKAAPTELFESQQEMFAAIRDERYNKDEAYTAKVTARIRASREAGKNLGI